MRSHHPRIGRGSEGIRAVITFLILVVTVPPAAWCDTARPATEDFPRPEALEPAVAFWKDVFYRYDFDQVVFVDGYDLSRVYEIRRIPTPDGTRSRERLRDRVRAELKEEIRLDLEALARQDVDYDALTGRQERLFRVWDGSRDPEVYARAAENLRGQRGIRNSFVSGVERSARYVEAFREVFREEGVPEDLAYLPHIESSFLWNARSGVGAVGMWQIMRSTGKRFLHIDEGVDERLDPYSAARAAARYLKELHDELGSWPLAITAYNQGPATLSRARAELGTGDIAVIAAEYRGPGFGFMGRNFYAEFLAARDLADLLLADPDHHELVPDAPVAFRTFTLPQYVKVTSLAQAFDVSPGDLSELNLGFTRSTRRGEEYLPKGYALKVPAHVEVDEALFASIPSSERHDSRPQRQYRVRSGDSLSTIAAKFATSVRTLQRLNDISDPNRLRAGQVLKLPR